MLRSPQELFSDDRPKVQGFDSNAGVYAEPKRPGKWIKLGLFAIVLLFGGLFSLRSCSQLVGSSDSDKSGGVGVAKAINEVKGGGHVVLVEWIAGDRAGVQVDGVSRVFDGGAGELARGLYLSFSGRDFIATTADGKQYRLSMGTPVRLPSVDWHGAAVGGARRDWPGSSTGGEDQLDATKHATGNGQDAIFSRFFADWSESGTPSSGPSGGEPGYGGPTEPGESVDDVE